MGFKREKRNGAERGEERSERSERRSSGREDRGSRRSSRGSSRGGDKFAFTHIGSVKQGRRLNDKDAAELKGCEESLKIQLYMPNVVELTLEKDALIGIVLGKRQNDKNFVLGQAYLPLGSVTPTKKTNDDLVDFLADLGEETEFDMTASIYLPKGVETVTLEHGKTMLLSFKTGEKAEDLDFVLGTLSLANDED